MPNVVQIRRCPPLPKPKPHECYWPDCTELVPPAKWGCRKHWAKLPQPIRHRLWATYREGQDIGLAPITPEYLAAAQAAQDWINR